MADVLVIENNACINELLREILAGDGHNVSTSQTGATALSLIGKKEFDLAFVDLGLPDISGLSVIKRIKQASPTTGLIVISGRSDFESVAASFRERIFDYLLKPFDIDEVIRIANLAIAERKKTLETQNNSQTNEILKVQTPSIRLLAAFLSLLAVGGGFLGGMGLQSLIFKAIKWQSTIQFNQIAFLTLSLCCCWVMILIRNHKEIAKLANKNMLNHDALNVGFAYIIFAAILFFISPLSNSRMAMLTGYVLGVAAITFNREILISWLVGKMQAGREGHKRIIIIGKGKEVDLLKAKLQSQFGQGSVKTIQNRDWQEDRTNVLYRKAKSETIAASAAGLTAGPNELYIDGRSLDGEELNRIVSNFEGNNIVINYADETDKREFQPKVF